MSIIVFLALFLPVILFGSSVFVFRTNDKVLKLITAFSGAYLLAISFLEILPEIYKDSEGMTIGLFVLLGFFIQLLLDYITKGVEHGHQHHDCNENHPHLEHTKPHLPVAPVIFGLFIHSFLEGMPLAESFNMPDLRNTLLTGIAIHNVPISIVLVSLALAGNPKNITKAVIYLGIFSLGGPLGVLTSNLIGTGMEGNSNQYFNIIMAIVVGIFLHISTTILFETDEHHRFNWLKFLVIIAGGTTAWFVA